MSIDRKKIYIKEPKIYKHFYKFLPENKIFHAIQKEIIINTRIYQMLVPIQGSLNNV